VTAPCQCSGATAPCQTGPYERPRYFPGQLVGAVDLNLQQEYFRNRMRLHNRMLHGWGVVCGALVCLSLKAIVNGRARRRLTDECHTVPPPGDDSPDLQFEPWKVRIQPGFILGPYGDEILIESERIIDLRTRCVTSGPGAGATTTADPWCTTPPSNPEEGSRFVAVRYKEVATRPVRVQPAGCGCDELECQDSRWHDCYEICILDHCPESHHVTEPNRREPHAEPEFPRWLQEIAINQCAPNPSCPECPEEPWVVLAEVQVNSDGQVTLIDNCSCRRIVASFAGFSWRCCRPMPPEPVEPDPNQVPAGYTPDELPADESPEEAPRLLRRRRGRT